MTEADLKFKPHSDMSIYDQSIVNEHQNLIINDKLSDATTLLNEGNYNKGFRASLFNDMQDKIHMVQEFLLNKEDVEYIPDEVVSDTEPIDSESTFWLADY